jgi:hypothetical protein
MVRADTLTRAKELEEIYDRNTELDLAYVNGHHRSDSQPAQIACGYTAVHRPLRASRAG